MGAGRNAGTTMLANSAPTTGSSCICHAPSGLPKALQPGGACPGSRSHVTFPFLLDRGRQPSNEADDFRSNDFPKHGPNTEALLCAWRLRDDQTLIGEMVLVLKALAGAEGLRAVQHFVHGGGAKLPHPPGSPLSGMAFRSWQFLLSYSKVILRIKEGVKRLAAGGKVPDFSALRVPVPATHWGLRTFPVKLEDAENTALKAIIGGTQGEELWATALQHNPASKEYELDLRWVILDHFGVSSDDLYAPGLIPFYVLQHERQGYRPYVNEIVIRTSVKGTY